MVLHQKLDFVQMVICRFRAGDRPPKFRVFVCLATASGSAVAFSSAETRATNSPSKNPLHMHPIIGSKLSTVAGIDDISGAKKFLTLVLIY